MAEKTGSCLCQNYLQWDGEMGKKLWVGDKKKSWKLVAPKNKGSVLQNFRNWCKHYEKFGNYVWYFCFLRMELIENYLVLLTDEMHITFQGKILLYDRLLKTVDEIGGKIIIKSWGKTQSAKYGLVNLGNV